MSADPAFLGNPRLVNPEQLLAAAISSCQMLSFLALAARAKIDVRSYQDSVRATMSARTARVETAALSPVITVHRPADPEAVVALVYEAHEQCFIARSVTTVITIEPRVEVIERAER
jgi:organic hydroperoxide reductase OsmC/OhrA